MLCANKHLPFVCIVHLFIYLMDFWTWLKANAFFERGLLCGMNPIRQNSSMVEHLFMISEIIVVYRKVNNHQMMKMEAGVQSWEDCSVSSIAHCPLHNSYASKRQGFRTSLRWWWCSTIHVFNQWGWRMIDLFVRPLNMSSCNFIPLCYVLM